MFSKLFSKNEVSVGWNNLDSISQLSEIDEVSQKKPVLIFKHSTRCPISTMALSRFERSFNEEANFTPYFLDLISFREISNGVAEKYAVIHESPQALLISNGKSIYDSSHNGIDFEEINEKAKSLS
ncbi:MAG: bacillithiol system redox-active protein YtxJ [Bacteroidota bacterium]